MPENNLEWVAVYPVYSFIAVTLFAFIHLFGGRVVSMQGEFFRKYFYSVGGGVAIAYVFIDLMPKLCVSDALVSTAMQQYLPSMEKHVYLMALAGFILFYLEDRSERSSIGMKLSILSYSLFNFLVGYAIADPYNPEVRPLMLFTIALGLHFFVNDNALYEKLGEDYRMKERWQLALMLYLGWVIGFAYELPATAVALVSAFIGGGVVMNVIRHELPSENPNSTAAFLTATFFYAALLFFLGQRSLF